MNNFLKNIGEIESCTHYLQSNGLVESGLSCKNYDIAMVVPYLTDADILDMGSSGSEILSNAVRLKLKGRKVGIDLAYPENAEMDGIEIYKGDLQATLFNDNSFDTITCMSVIEHEVNFDRIAKECSRLLRSGGQLFVSFDFWNPKPDTSKMKLYSLSWNILDKDDVLNLVGAFKKNRLGITSEIDWTLQDAVINKYYCAPCDVEYTFGVLQFIKE